MKHLFRKIKKLLVIMESIKVRIAVSILFLFLSFQLSYGQSTKVEEVAPGVIKITVGAVDRFTPYSFCTEKPLREALKKLPEASLPFKDEDIKIKLTNRGTIIELPLTENEQLYGFGLQQNSFNQKGLKKKPVVNAYPLNDLGYSHAPVPYYVSTKGYGVLINTSRYTTFYCGVLTKPGEKSVKKVPENSTQTGSATDELYQNKVKTSLYVTVDVPQAKGIEVFIFLGPDMRNAVQRYNLFSGGGALPPLWGLGVKYRVKADFKQEQVIKMATYFREKHIPCDVIGLEPKWQTASYSCSYVWNKDYFPQPQHLIDSMKSMHFRLNLWEHAFVSPVSPLYPLLKDRSGDYSVWNGLVPDFADSITRGIFGNYHEQTFINQGISGFKLDECDNSDISRGNVNWSFPEISQFPSGIDGEQMHQMFGELYFKSFYDIYKKRNQRIYFDVRSSGTFASHNPTSLYSDTYNHREYVRMIAGEGFSGLLWSPEVRESNSVTELIRRSQTAVLSAQTLFNSWYLQNPPWLQFDSVKNNKGILLNNADEVESHIRKLLNLRMSLIPYLYSAFAKYNQQGIPPFRALVMDYPEDKNVFDLSDEYMIGESLLAAPIIGESSSRMLYLPKGNWYDFNTNKKYVGGKKYTLDFDLDQLPLFVKEGTILPFAKPVEYISATTVFDITCRVYGDIPAHAVLFEDDGVTYNYEAGDFNRIDLSFSNGKGHFKREGNYKKKLYQITKWEYIK